MFELAQAAQFPEQVTTSQLLQNVVYASGTVGALMVVVGLVNAIGEPVTVQAWLQGLLSTGGVGSALMHAVLAVPARRLPPAGRGHPALLAEQCEEDQCLHNRRQGIAGEHRQRDQPVRHEPPKAEPGDRRRK